MTRLVRRLSLVALLPAAMLAGCQPETAEAPPAAAPEVAKLPDCNSSEAVDVGPTGRSDCRLMATGKTGWGADLHYSGEPGGPRELTMRLTSEDGSEIQTITEQIDGTFGLPGFDDLDSDGRAELLIPLSTGTVNTTFAIWRSKDGEPDFERAGEVGGIDVSAFEDAMFVTPARGSVSTWYTTYYLFADNKVLPVATAENELGEDGETQTCTVTEGGGLSKIGLTLEAAQAKFCALE